MPQYIVRVTNLLIFLFSCEEWNNKFYTIQVYLEQLFTKSSLSHLTGGNGLRKKEQLMMDGLRYEMVIIT